MLSLIMHDVLIPKLRRQEPMSTATLLNWIPRIGLSEVRSKGEYNNFERQMDLRDLKRDIVTIYLWLAEA